MKKILHILLLMSLLEMVLSCNVRIESDQIQASDGIAWINAFFPDESKTVLGEDCQTVLWSPSDEISVFCNTVGVKFTSLNSSPADRTTFASDETIIAGGTEGSLESYLYGIYPYSESNAQDGEEVTLTVPSSQTAVEGSFGRGAYPCIGRSRTTDMAFYNVCGGMRFTLTRGGIGKVVLTGNNDETLAGTVRVSFDENGRPSVTSIVEPCKSITLTAPDGGQFATGKWYYISVLPTALKKGFSMRFVRSADDGEAGTKCVTTALEVQRAHFGSIENIDSGVPFKFGVAKLSVNPSGILVPPMSTVCLSLSILPQGADYKWIQWSSSDKDLANVDGDGIVVCNREEGKCVITVTSDNGTSTSCMVYICQTPVLTEDVDGMGYFGATLNGAFNVMDTDAGSAKFSFIYSCSESSLDGLISKGTTVSASPSVSAGGTAFRASLNGLGSGVKYYYTAAVTFFGRTYYGDVMQFTTKECPEIVDLGLSVKWRGWNIGASKPEEYGRYFAWGDVAGQTWDGEKWSGGGFFTFPEYKLDSNFNLEPEYDAAHVLLGGKWRMPTDAECSELISNTTSQWIKVNGVQGRVFTSKKNGNSIFLPNAGYAGIGLYTAGNEGYYWSRTLYGSTYYGNNYSSYLKFYYQDVYMTYGSRNDGFPVRPVSE